MTEWETKTIGDILSLEYGKPLPKADRDPSGAYPVYGANGEKAKSNKYYHDYRTIIVGRKGSAGECNLTEDKFWPLDVTYFVTFDQSEHELKFLFYMLRFQNLPRLAKGVKPGINRNDVYAIEVVVPPLAEQKRIVSILDEAFAAIERAKENAEKNLANARELFESYLNRIFTQKGKGWEEKNLADVAITFGRGKSRHRPRNDKSLYGGQYPFIQTGEIRNADHYVTEYSKTYNEIGLAQSKLWPAGTLCITIAANIAETAILTFDACIPDSIIGLVCDPTKANADYVEYLLQFFKTVLQSQGKGSAQDNINMGTFERNEFPFPSISEQERIVEVLSTLSEQKSQLEAIYQQKLANLDELKQSLLQKAFTGQLTAKQLENEVAV
ncbi:restriction endonuclease subunit S [Thalassoglobus polymorphus]|uniref:Type I restriction enzyme specificity protein n=1 Tax=Thalassoglobus polymorphus TaxID=2527994 RepID=A0A517QT51_9PLAN|nr:restriction endonuclease subunit S [Thalassoglobus polymorphus]QDT34820.1 Putative type I restriction enzyme specificity protein [Thalassoglobus polymorphus]